MSFIKDFLEYNAGNEAPTPFVLWASYGMLSAAMGQRVTYTEGAIKVTANIYILLVGPSGARKTFARDQAVDLLQEAIPDIPIAGDNETYQGIISYLDSDKSARYYLNKRGISTEYKPYCIWAPELMDYLQNNPVGMVAFLTNIYDRKFYTYRLKNEDKLLANPSVMMCACSTPEWLTDQLKAKQFAEGYGRRTIVVCHEGIKRKRPTLSENEKLAGKRCIDRLKQLAKLSGEFTMTEEADKFFWQEWYPSLKEPDNKFLKNWYSTLHINVLKCAMLTAVSEGDDLVITIDHLQLVIDLLMEIQQKLPMLTNLIGRSEIAVPAQHVLSVIRNNGGVMPEKLLKIKTITDFKNPQEQYHVFQHLISTGQVVKLYAGDTLNAEKLKLPPGTDYLIPNEK